MTLAVGLPEQLAVRTVPVRTPEDLLARLPHSSVLAWVRHGEGLVGWGEAARVAVPPGEDRFTWARQWLTALFDAATVDDPLRVPGSGPVAFGSFSFDPRSGDSVLIVPRTVLGRRDGQAWYTTIGERPDPLTLLRPPAPPAAVRWADGDVTAPRHMRAVAAAVRRIRAGHLSKVVLARDLLAVADEPIDSRILLRRLADRFPSCYTFACAGLVGATPELLVRRMGGQVESLVLAGTIARGSDSDSSAASTLFASAKDREEHSYAADMVRAALAPLCRDLTVPAEPEILRLSNLIHLATPVRGRLEEDRSVLDVVGALHPTPAVGGTPTDTALDLIRELEAMDRGRYAGPVGWIDARGDGEWGIALRCAQVEGPRARLYAGGGIVAGSDPAAELEETQTKLRAMQYAIEG
ncbi:isochorismate synthase [Actinoallomurus spadix]|uniref:isochorismate synthase n=1 Tax=Actinoallomurus spadix TaxID=79912 RepID=A0ABP3GGT6_9ACTN|nr:isochorismate synthase [Actinoallomurus spadix]MCO5984721.1 isochorismate synthase [Actinoallomurus spadix]